MITIHPGEIPEEGLRLSGSLEKDIFQLDPGDNVQPGGPTRYELQIFRSGDLVIAQGTVEAPFRLQCVVCLESFPFTCIVPDYVAEFDLEGDGEIDLGDRLREDLLLALPAYPHCDRADDSNRICPMADRLGASESEPEAGRKPSAWDALDGLETAGESGA